MKLLLTSAGITSPAIGRALEELAGRPLTETKILVIITASTVTTNDKSWLIKGLQRIQAYDFKLLDILDFAALPEKLWRPRFEAADIIYFTGGNPYHLLNQVQKSGLAELLPELLKSRVYVGHSAGTAIAGHSLGYSSPKAYVPAELGPQPIPALGLVDFCVRSHLGNTEHPAASEEKVRKLFEQLKTPVYAIGDHSAVKVDGDTVELIGEEPHLKFG
jgi:dipeptidase E